ncbi:hypothetical protein [Hoylesella pleuritidis]|uniref:hypothetical protein n=1 Tax=Hoylesella pleuritidis TaxID=407975 RepID=UPI00235755FF|nr:hypothetical protein [Hoylesella pleuritidis]
MKKNKNALTMKTLTKSNVWDIQETDIFRLWEAAEKDADLKDNIRHYTDILRGAFEIEEVKVDKPEIIKKYEERGFKIGTVRTDDSAKVKWAVRKRPIMRVTDLTYENIRHISAQKLLEVLDRNFGGGWDSLSQSIKDIIEHGFDISTTTLPQDRLHKTGGMYEKKVNDGFEVLEIPKGTWIEAIFAKEKSETEESRIHLKDQNDIELRDISDEENENEGQSDRTEKYNDDDDDSYDEDKLTEESYRTTFDTDPEDLNLEAEDVSDEEAF